MSDNAPAETADALWGPGNWVLCKPCPRNDGHACIHANNFHDTHEQPTGVLRSAPVTQSNAPFCAEEFRVRGHRGPTPFMCELPEGHHGRHGIPRMDRWGPEPV